MQNFIAYIRVSTQRQGASGLGLDAQRMAVAAYLRGRGDLVGEIVEIESGRKAGKHRPELVRALARCKAEGAALVIGKLDRLARDVRFFLEVIDDSGVDIRFADLPDICPATDEGRMILVSMANFAEFEGRRIGTRTKAALAAAKSRGVKLGTAGRHNLKPNIEARQAAATNSLFAPTTKVSKVFLLLKPFTIARSSSSSTTSFLARTGSGSDLGTSERPALTKRTSRAPLSTRSTEARSGSM